jgi:glycine cleavage system aminomethyltransferase T
LKDRSQGTRLWNIVREAGAPHGIGPGSPNWAERIESGLLSYGGDTNDQTNPFEVRLGKYVGLDLPHEVVGIRALRRIHAEGPKRHLLGVVLDNEVAATAEFGWTEIRLDDSWIGDMTNCAWSYRMQRNIGFALVLRRAVPGDRVTVLRKMGPVQGCRVSCPFCNHQATANGTVSRRISVSVHPVPARMRTSSARAPPNSRRSRTNSRGASPIPQAIVCHLLSWPTWMA